MLETLAAEELTGPGDMFNVGKSKVVRVCVGFNEWCPCHAKIGIGFQFLYNSLN